MPHTRPLIPNIVVVRSSALIEGEIDNEIVALNIENGTCYGLNRVGSNIWRLLRDPIRISKLCAILETQYEVVSSDCARQVIELLEQMRDEGLIRVLDDATLQRAPSAPPF